MGRAAVVGQAWRTQCWSITRMWQVSSPLERARSRHGVPAASSLVLLTQLLFPDLRSRAELGSQLLRHCAFAIQAPSRFPNSLGCKPDFLVYPPLPSFPQQKSAHVGKTPTTWVSVSPMLFQGHPLLQTNLSVSEVTDHFSAWLV